MYNIKTVAKKEDLRDWLRTHKHDSSTATQKSQNV